MKTIVCHTEVLGSAAAVENGKAALTADPAASRAKLSMKNCTIQAWPTHGATEVMRLLK